MAKQYTLLDRMFPDMFGPSFTGHLTLIAGTTAISPKFAEIDLPVNQPYSCDSGPTNETTLVARVGPSVATYHAPMYYQKIPPCFTQFETIAEVLDAKHVTWKYYAPTVQDEGGQIWSEFGAIKKVRYGPDWANVVTPQTTVLTDVAAGKLPAVSWVIPDIIDSDHPSGFSNKGPSWVSTVVNAIGESKYWNSTAIIVVWDDWGDGTTTFLRRSWTMPGSAYAFRRCSSLRTRSRTRSCTRNSSSAVSYISSKTSSRSIRWAAATPPRRV